MFTPMLCGDQVAKATHSISQPLPNLSCIDQTVRAGGSIGKNSRYTRSISGMSARLASTTCTRTTRSSDEPADSSMCCILASVVRICSAIAPWLRSSVSGSIGPIPDRNMYGPSRIPGTCGRLAPRETLRRGFFGSIAERGSFAVIGSHQGRAFDDHFRVVGKARAADRTGGRRLGKETGIDLVHVRRLQHAMQEHVHLYDFVERRAGCLQQLLEVDKDLSRFARGRAAPPLPGIRIDRHKAGDEEKVATPDQRRYRRAEAARAVACKRRGDNDFASGRHRSVPQCAQAAAMTSRSTLKPASICAVHTVRAGGPFATYCR